VSFRHLRQVMLASCTMILPTLASGATVTLTSSLSSGQPVGSTIKWTATSISGMLYQFSVAYGGGPFTVLRDASISNSFVWTPMQEGYYTIHVLVMAANYQGTRESVNALFHIVSRVTAGAPVVNTTNNPLVALYSSPPCGTGSIYVQFETATNPSWQQTNTQSCSATLSSNFYVAGMKASTAYQMQQVVTNGATTMQGPILSFTTGAVTQAFPSMSLAVAPSSLTSSEPVLLHGMMNTQDLAVDVPFATDLYGNVIWYFNQFSSIPGFYYMTRPVAGGTFLVLASFGRKDDLLVEIDMAGNVVRETDMLRINAQLVGRGDEEVVALHHEATRFPNGQTLVLGMIQRPTSNGGAILGDMIIALDQNLQVLWTWDAFNYLSTSRGPVLGEDCMINYASFCPASDPYAIDWLHSNSLGYTPDHNLIISMRDQDWVLKIDYQDGTGPGDIIWTLGADGDFTIQSSDPYPWFSHQHDVLWLGTNEITLFDNGNTRCTVEPSPCDSRGQVLQIDETNHIATLVLNGDLGVKTTALGSAQLLSNGDYHFGPGYIVPNGNSAATEVNASNNLEYNLLINATEYRTFRMPSLYVPPIGQ
jgi:arylsulfate sulfotransferase